MPTACERGGRSPVELSSGNVGDLDEFFAAAATACIDAYEASVRAACDVQFTLARALDVEPIRSIAATWGDLTRDVGATAASSARWLLDI